MNTCEHCAAPITDARRVTKRFCTTLCKERARRAREVETRPARHCLTCGLPLGVGARPYRRYCDEECRYRARANSEGREPRDKGLDERLWGRLVQDGECWVWTGGLTSAGYGEIVVDGEQRLTHRVVWELMRGEIPFGLHIDHLCRNRPCCNPDHLDPVTPAENQRRGMVARGVERETGSQWVTRDTPRYWSEWSPA